MRDVDLSFEPNPHAAYFGHVSSSLSGDAVGLVVLHIENGRFPCSGFDIDPDDGYAGDVCTDAHGAPLADVPVQYFRAAQGAERRTERDVVGAARTDAQGRHSLWIPPGTYRYRYGQPEGRPGASLGALSGAEREVVVEARRAVTWESQGTDGGAQEPVTLVREIGMVCEDAVCDWTSGDGHAFSWPDVEHVIAQAAAKAPFRYITFDRTFCKPDLITALQRRGVPAWPGEITDSGLATAYRNMYALGRAECLSLMLHGAANFQLRNCVQWVNEKHLTVPEGEYKYLADARACAIYYAAQAASMEQPQAEEDAPQLLVPRLDHELGREAAMSQVLEVMNPTPRPRGAVPEVRTVLLGEGKKHKNWRAY